MDAVLRLLGDADPHGLRPGAKDGAPADELLAEATQISAIARERACAVDDVDRIWRRWFGAPSTDVLGADATRDLVGRIDDLRTH